jgi:predicted peptidase
MRVICIFLLLVSPHLLQAQKQTAENMRFDLDYLLYLPAGYENDTVTKWPLLVFLHGGGESGNDIELVRKQGLPLQLQEGKEIPLIVASPQSRLGFGWENDLLASFVVQLQQNLRVDRERIYLTGLSFGGYGTWSLAKEHPQFFAAIVPICGGGDTTDIWKLRKLPIWAFHGAKDDVVFPIETEKMVNAARRYNREVNTRFIPKPTTTRGRRPMPTTACINGCCQRKGTGPPMKRPC